MPFRDVIGHRRLVGLLARSVCRELLPPSLIFAGPAGVGKRLAALATAQALNCTARFPKNSEPNTDIECDACGMCTVCARIARGVHPDVLIVEPGDSGSIKIEQVRDIVDRAAYRPFEGRRRAVIIGAADALVPAAQQALLKTLEEPPPSSVFMLITARPDMLLPTVRSRCPRLQFRPLGQHDIAAAMVARGHSESEARAVAATADGSLARALDTSAGDLAEARDVELLSTRADVRALANPDVQPALERLTKAYDGERGMRAFTAVDRALLALDRNAGVKIVADWLVLQL